MQTTPSGGPSGPTPARSVRRRFPVRHRFAVGRSRTGGWWVALVAAAFVLLLLLIFVLQNGRAVQVSFLGAHATLPLGIALLLAAIAGVLIVAIPGTGRIIQLRHLAQNQAGRQVQPGTPAPPEDPPVTTAPADSAPGGKAVEPDAHDQGHR